MTPGPGIEHGTHWWEASALTTAPSLLCSGTGPSIYSDDKGTVTSSLAIYCSQSSHFQFNKDGANPNQNDRLCDGNETQV